MTEHNDPIPAAAESPPFSSETDSRVARQDTNDSQLLYFLNTLYNFKAEIEEREPAYFDYQPLRMRNGLCQTAFLALREKSGSSSFAGDTLDFCELVGATYGISLILEKNDCESNAVDRLFESRLNEHRPQLSECERGALQEHSIRNPGPADNKLRVLQSVHIAQVSAHAARTRQVTQLPNQLHRRKVEGSGSELGYFVAGSGDRTVVLLNALGQGLHYWYRLISVLMLRHRVVIWEPRISHVSGARCDLQDQVSDLDAILRSERIDDCHLVGWCTGPKVAIEYYLRNLGAIRSMAFLNSSFKCDGISEDLETPFEQNLESLCRIIHNNPDMAPTAQQSLQSASTRASLDDLLRHASSRIDRETLATAVLSRINVDLGAHVAAPFRTDESTRAHVEQLLDFWSIDIREKAGLVEIPVLLVAAEYDEIASPSMSHEAVRWFSHASVVEVPGATHYCLYDRPEWLAALLEDFFGRAENKGLRVSTETYSQSLQQMN